jgi:SAM-dependent methyltransferase
MTESPDIPWARHDDDHGKPGEFKEKPSPAAVFFKGFISSKGIRHGTVLDVGCGNGRDSVYFSQSGFEVHALDICSGPMEGLERYGVRVHCASATEFWLFENGSFDLVMDVMCYSGEPDPERKKFYRGELLRVMKDGGYFMLSVPDAFKKSAKKEFTASGFSIAASNEAQDDDGGKAIRTANLILSKM